MNKETATEPTTSIARSMADKIAKKKISLIKDESKKARLVDLVKQHEGWIASVQEDIDLKTSEVDQMTKLMAGAMDLDAKLTKVQEEIEAIVAKFNAIPWRPDLAWEEKIESSDYAKMVAYRDSLSDKLDELQKDLNRVYYRR
jgi:hypothetical protein